MTLERIGPYRVVRKLGEGGMGAVLEAVQEPIGRRVAVKVLHRKYAMEPQITARFFNEARAVNLIDHPGIVQVSDYGQLPDGTAYLVMEFLKGETLSARAKRGGMSLPDIVRVARQVTAALAAAHEKNVFHRDLKPDNIMIVPDPDADTPGRERVKLLDFGIAKVVPEGEQGDKGPKTATDVVMGTPRYMAPEQCRGGVTVDGKADVYSLGVLLYELLAGKPPFSGASGEVLAMHIYEQPPPLKAAAPHVPEEFTILIHRLLAKKREERPSMSEVQTALESLSVRHPTSVLQAIKWQPPPGLTAPSTPGAVTPASTPGVPAQPSTLGMSTGQAEAVRAKKRQRLLIPLLTFVVALGTTATLWRIIRPTEKPKDPTPVVQTPTEKPKDPTPVTKPAGPVEVTPLRVHIIVNSTPSGAQVLRPGEQKPIGITPYSLVDDAAPGQLDLRLRLPGYAEKIIHLDRSADATLTETLEPLKKPLRPGVPGRPFVPGRPGNPGGKLNPNGPKNPNTKPKDEQPRIVD